MYLINNPNIVPTPRWAKELLYKVCHNEGALLPALTWKHPEPDAPKRGSGGITLTSTKHPRCKIIIEQVPGDSHDYDRILLLHEIAHVINRANGHKSHDKHFWEKAFYLYGKYGANIPMALNTECTYMIGAIYGARRNGYHIPKEIEKRYKAYTKSDPIWWHSWYRKEPKNHTWPELHRAFSRKFCYRY